MPKGHAVQKSVSFTLSVSHAGVLGTAAGVAHDQAEADEEMSLQQRLILAGGSVLEGTSEMVDNEVISGAMEVGGRCLYILALFCAKFHLLEEVYIMFYVVFIGTVVKDQAEAEEDASLRERAGLAAGKDV